MSKRIKIAAAFALAAVLAAVMGAVAFGSDTDSGSLTVVTNASAGTPLRLYKVADFGEDYVFTLTDDFAGQSLELDGLDDEKWQKLADTFSNFVASAETEIPCAETEADGEKAVLADLAEDCIFLTVFIGSKGENSIGDFRLSLRSFACPTLIPTECGRISLR